MKKLFSERRETFPDPRNAWEGVVELSDDLRVERLLEAYSFGIFPWPQGNLPTLWCSPERRGVLDFSEFHVARSLRKAARQNEFTFTFNRAFRDVIEGCAGVQRPGQAGTWITKKMLRAYLDFYSAGYAHSLEVWLDEALVGGLYGVFVAGVFCGESMFFRIPNASKLALVHLVDFLRGAGLTWMDIQMVTPVLESFGGKYISREEYLGRLESAKAAPAVIGFPAAIAWHPFC
jgi:leucyl/phenylalanyl-tRNA--protein transferase